MKRWKNWVFPLLTLLAVVGAALAPQQLSLLRDGRLSGEVHTEPLTDGNNFSLWAPSLAERIELAARYMEGDEVVSSAVQDLYHEALADCEALALVELDSLAERGVLPPNVRPKTITLARGSRIYLWTPGTLGGAGFLFIHMEDTGPDWSMNALIDEETGRFLSLEVYSPQSEGYGDWSGAADFGGQFLDGLELDYQLCFSAGDTDAFFLLDETSRFYQSVSVGCYFFIMPQSMRLNDKSELPLPEDQLVSNSEF